MTNLIRAELRKIATTKLWWALLLGAALTTALATVATLAAGQHSSDLARAHDQQTILAAVTYADIFTLVAGIIGITTEYRHLTSRHTFLFEPRRGKIIAAKQITYALLGVGYAIACTLTVLAIALPWLAAEHIAVEWTHNQLIWVLVGGIASITIFAVAGIGVGALVHNQVAAITGALAYLLLLGPLTQLIPGIKTIYPWLPGSAADATVDAGHFNGHLLHPAIGGVVFLLWSSAFVVAGTWTTNRRDLP